MIIRNVFGDQVIAGPTANSGTAIVGAVPSREKFQLEVARCEIYNGSTASQTLTLCRPIGRTTVKTAAAASATSLILTNDPGVAAGGGYMTTGGTVADNAIAGNDYIIVQYDDGTFAAIKVTTVASAFTQSGAGQGTLTVPALAGTIAAGKPVWNFGVITDTDPRTGLPHPIFRYVAPSAANTQSLPLLSDGSALCRAHTVDEPMFFSLQNQTTACFINGLVYRYSQNG